MQANNNTGTAGEKSLVAYFSYSGKTKQIAEWIAEKTGADIFRIEPEETYPSDYNECVEEARIEHDTNQRPAFIGEVEDISRYKKVFVGFPCWWYTCPMIVLTFLEKYDFSGKTIIPFVTHGGSGFSGSIKDMKEACPDSEFAEGIAISDSQVPGAKQRLMDWLAELGE